MNIETEIDLQLDEDTPLYSIGVVAEILQMSVQSLRSYENEGLVLPFKKDSKHRLYTKNDIIRLRCIKDAIKQKKFSIAAIKTIYSLIPCWSIKNCSENERENCEAYKGTMNPCWMYKHQDNICEDLKCSNCVVYKNHNHCDSIKETITKYTRDK